MKPQTQSETSKVKASTKKRMFEVISNPTNSPWWKVRIDYGPDGATRPVELEILSHTAMKRIYSKRLREMEEADKLRKAG